MGNHFGRFGDDLSASSKACQPVPFLSRAGIYGASSNTLYDVLPDNKGFQANVLDGDAVIIKYPQKYEQYLQSRGTTRIAAEMLGLVEAKNSAKTNTRE